MVKGSQDGSERFRLSRPAVADDSVIGTYDMSESYDWRGFLDKEKTSFVPVERFEHAPLSSIFHHLKIGLKVEVPNIDYAPYSQSIGGVFWVATVVRMAGYRVLLRYEGYESDEGAGDFWMNFCSQDLHPVGWCAHNGKPLVPPRELQERQEDWKSFLVKKLTGARTLPQDWQEKIERSLRECPFREGTHIELVDRYNPQRVRPAVVKRVVARRLNLILSKSDLPEKAKSKENQEHPEDPTQGTSSKKKGKKESEKDDDDDEDDVDEEFWCDQGSPLIFPVAWAVRVGYGLKASEKYKQRCRKIVEADPEGTAKEVTSPYLETDATPGMFCRSPQFIRPEIAAKLLFCKTMPIVRAMEKAIHDELVQWKAGMKLECIDPLDYTQICPATVVEVMKGGHLKMHFDGNDAEDTVVVHKSSPYLFPVGYCQLNAIDLTPPKGISKVKFNWESYLKQMDAVAAPDALFDPDNYNHGFEVGGKVEAVDMVEPRLVCCATVVGKKGGRLLRVKFDGWDDSYNQWADFRSADLFPLGWCEMVGYKLEAPHIEEPHEQQQQTDNKKRQQQQVPSGGPKKPKKSHNND